MADSRSGAGGKIVANWRPQRLVTTPYDRPPPSQSPPPPAKSPNWFSGIIFPSARAVASGAGKIISSVLYSESESSSEDEDEDSAAVLAEDDLDNDNDYEIPSDGVNALNERTETKRIIEKLIMQETFSREECDRLTILLKSRVMDSSMEAEKRLAASSQKMIDNEDGDIYNKAVLEAKKWFQENEMGSSSVTKPDNVNCNLRPSGIEHVDSGVGSPVDVARSYMRDRPPWASPTKNVELRTPLTTTMELFKEGTSYSVGHDSFSSSKKRSSLASGSWNIQEELRRVRSKATEDMLRTPSSKIDPSLFAVATSRQESGGAGEVVSGMGERTTEPDSLRQTKQIGVLMDAGVSSDPALAALESRQDGKASEALSSKPATLASGNDEDSEAIQIDGECSASKFPLPTNSNAGEHHSDPHLSTINGPPANEAAEFGGRQGVNGFSSSQASLSAGVGTRQNPEQYDEENHDANTVSKNKSANTINLEGNCELLTEVYIEVPIVTETDSIASGSQNSLGVQYEEISQETIQPSTKGNPDKMLGKQQVQKSGENLRRSRRRGK